MPSARSRPHTVGASSFDPDTFFEQWDESIAPVDNHLQACIQRAFKLKPNDDYVYHAIASVTLEQVQVAINHGNANGMHAWYRDGKGEQIPPPPAIDITAYTQIFSPTTQTTKALTAFASNAKKGSLRAEIASYLQSQLLLPEPSTGLTLPPKQKTPERNPYYDMWVWSCHNLEWAGPIPGTAQIKQSHHILPIFYHHFGCVVPTHDALSIIQHLSKHGTVPKTKSKEPARPIPIVEIGSGNGYWAYLLRRLGLTVLCVDNQLSSWRTIWIGDTIAMDGVRFLESSPAATREVVTPPIKKGASNAVLLLVYPQVSADFTAKVIGAYEGDVVVVAGTQNGNGFTGFRDETIGAWMEREKGEFREVVQVPLPSFAGKDEALFVFVRVKVE